MGLETSRYLLNLSGLPVVSPCKAMAVKRFFPTYAGITFGEPHRLLELDILQELIPRVHKVLVFRWFVVVVLPSPLCTQLVVHELRGIDIHQGDMPARRIVKDDVQLTSNDTQGFGIPSLLQDSRTI